jgi:hypothetical protein
MRASSLIPSLAVGLLVAFPSNATGLSYVVSLQTPRFESLQTSLSPTGGTVNVELQVGYDLAGKAAFTGTVDGVSVAGKPTLKTGPAGTTYKFALRVATIPATVISISGMLGTDAAACSYSGPKGRTNVMANSVTVGALQPVPATIHLSPLISPRNVITGTARIDAGYTTNLIVDGTVNGKVSSNLISLAVKQGKRSATFTGRLTGNAYVGSLRLSIPPARETITNFSLPLTDVSVAAGVAVFRGSLAFISNQLPTPAAGSRITIRTDANADGKFLGKEVITAVPDPQGRYQVNATVVRGRPVMLEIRRPGFAEILQAYPSVTPGAVLTRNATLQALDDLEVMAGSAESTDGSIRLDGLPMEIESVQARVFNPLTDGAQFPGEFADNQGNLLVSSVFSTIEATDRGGRSVTNLGTNATLCMRVPVESWANLGDLFTGTGQIDVPLYYYDEATGQWKRNTADGWLEDSVRAKIPEDQLAAIRGGTYAGEVFAAGPISHLSWWNLDWPISSHTCIKGLIVDTNGVPVTGASVQAFGLTYNGTSGPETTGPDGLLCLEVMRSELPGEDVDGDGTLGETQQVQLKVQSGTNLFSFGPFSSPTSAATCTNGIGLDVGSLVLNNASLLTVSMCSITGRVVYSGISIGGTPTILAGGGVRSARVIGYDQGAFDPAAGSCSNCLVTTADAQGYFSLQTPVQAGATLSAFANVGGFAGYGVFIGQLTTAGCPSGPVMIEADYFHFGTNFLLTLFDGGDFWGTATLFQDRSIRVVSLPTGSGIYYLGGWPDVGLPIQTGPWAVVPMRNSTPGTGIGKIYFTTISLFPPAGTWELKDGTVRASGTWSSGFDLP